MADSIGHPLRRTLAVLLLAMASATALALPDLKRGQAALAAGDRAGAEREYRASK